MKFKGFKQFLVDRTISDNNYQAYESVMNYIDTINEDEGGLGSKIANWLFVAPKIKRLMGQANQARLNKVKVEADFDESIRRFNLEFEEELDTIREKWKAEIQKLKEKGKESGNDTFSDKADKYKETLATKLKDMKDAHRLDKKDNEDAFSRKIEALDDEIRETEAECDELANGNEYLEKIKRTVKLKGIIEADKAKMVVATDAEQIILIDKTKRYKKELETLSADIKKAIDDNKRDITWSEEQH